ncbi:MAG: GHKL domain-containing protein [Bacteroidales bacterium]|nr:GHKL domain-containing protein [Bacteroidales bacterium]
MQKPDLDSDFTGQELEHEIIRRIVIYSVVVIGFYISFIIAGIYFYSAEASMGLIIYPFVIAMFFASYFLLKKLNVGHKYIKNYIYLLFVGTVIGSFFDNNGLSGFAIIDIIDLFAVGIFIFTKKSRILAISANIALIAIFAYFQFSHPGLIRYNISFNEQFTLIFGVLSRLVLSYNIFTAVIDAYTNERKRIIQKNQMINEYSDELIKQNSKISELNEELGLTNENLHKANEELYQKNISLEDTLKNLNEAQLKLYQSEKMASLGVLTAGVAHEINNPLNFILGGYTGLENYFERNNFDDKKISLLMNSIKTGIDRASGIVAGLNQFSRNNESLDEECDIHIIIDNCLIILNNQIKDKITIEKNISAEHSVIYGNTGKLHQVFINLLGNAIHSIQNTGAINITTNNQSENIVIEIADTGCGISKENLFRITEPFFTTKEPGKGTGLGLAIVYSIIKEHKGIIWFESELNKGTKVFVNLPVNKKTN